MHVYFTGHAAGGLYYEGGGGANYLCLPEDPQWDNFRNGVLDGHIGGIEYEFFDTDNNIFDDSNAGGVPLLDSPAPCAVCYVDRHSVLMVPARMDCPTGWSKEYGGYLVSQLSPDADRKRMEYGCWDRAPEIAAGARAQNHAVIYPVSAICGSLPC